MSTAAGSSDPLAGFKKLVAQIRASGNVPELTVEQVKAKLAAGERFKLVDVREDEEWREGHARGAIHLGKGVIERDIGEDIPELDAEIVLYCGGGSRSLLAAEQIQRMGYRRVYSMMGGFRGWEDAGLPVEK